MIEGVNQVLQAQEQQRQMAIQTSLAKTCLDMQESIGNAMVQLIDQANPANMEQTARVGKTPGLGEKFDVSG